MERVLSLPFYDLLEELSLLYIKEYGQIEFKKIVDKVHSSPKLKKFLIKTYNIGIAPVKDDFMQAVHSVLYFTFSKPEKISMGSAILLSKWHQEVAKNLNIDDNLHLNETLFDILKKSQGFKVQLDNKENFFTKFLWEIEEKYAKINQSQFSKYNPITKMALVACENQILNQNLKYPIGKLDCFIFYSTYISLLTSFLELSNTDNIEFYLMEGINSYSESLGLEKDNFYQDFEEYVKSRSYIFTNAIKEKYNFDLKKNPDTLNYISLFEANDFIEIEDVELSDTSMLFVYFDIIISNLKLIDDEFDIIKNNAKDHKLKGWNTPAFVFNWEAHEFIEHLVIKPFQENRCQICGDFVSRENLKLNSYYDSEYGHNLLLPMCENCYNKN